MMVINDLRGAGLFQSREKRFFKVLGQCSEMLEYLCPQQQMKSVMLNPPSFMATMFSFLKPIMPKKALAKIAICPGETLLGAFGDCPFAKAYWPQENVPDFLGGTHKIPENHRLFVAPAAPIEDNVELQLAPKRSWKEEVSVPAEKAKVELQFMCMPHGMAMMPGIEVIVKFVPTTAAGDPDSGRERVIMEKTLFKPQEGRVRREWSVDGPGLVVANLWNPAIGKHKTLRYALKLLGTTRKAQEEAKAATAVAAKELAAVAAALDAEPEEPKSHAGYSTQNHAESATTTAATTAITTTTTAGIDSPVRPQ